MELVVQALNDPSLLSTAVVHSLPCRIHRTGPAPVDRYFCVVEQDKDKTRLKASFRGRALAGKAVHVPDGYVGFVAREASAAVVTAVNSSKGKGKGKRHDDDDNDDDNDMQEGPQRMWTIAGGFEHFVCWDHDDEPTDENELVRLAEWVTVADAVRTLRNACCLLNAHSIDVVARCDHNDWWCRGCDPHVFGNGQVPGAARRPKALHRCQKG